MTRIALVGAGAVAQRHVDVLRGLHGVEVVSVTDPAQAAASSLASSCGARAFTSAEESLDAVPADAVYICVPPFAHGPPEVAALDRGLPIFVEKPLALDLPTAVALADRVAAADVVTGTGYHWRCLDTLDRARDLLCETPPLLAMGYWLDKRPPVGWWGRRDRSGGQVVEQLTHVLDLARVLLGEAEAVYAVGVLDDTEPPQGREADDIEAATAATVRFASGAVATLAATSLLSAKRAAGLDIIGRGRTLELSEVALIVDDGATRVEHTPSVDAKTLVDAEFIAAVRGERESTRAPYAEVLGTHRLACALTESVATGRPTRIVS